METTLTQNTHHAVLPPRRRVSRRKAVILVAALCLAASPLFAFSCSDHEENANGYTWSYHEITYPGDKPLMAIHKWNGSDDGGTTAVSPKPTGVVTIPSTLGYGDVNNIGIGAFYGCSDMTGVNIPDTVQNIEDSAFEDCSGLTSVTLPYRCAYIGDNAFSHCTCLTSVEIPARTHFIGENAFSGCTAITDVYLHADPNGLNWEDASDSFKPDGSTKIHVKAEHLSAYQSKFGSTVNGTFVCDNVVNFTVTFDSNGGVFSGANFGSMDGKSGTAAVPLTYGKGSYGSGMRAVKSGAAFEGWWTATTGGTPQYDANGKCIPGEGCWNSAGLWNLQSNAKLYARFGGPHTLKFDSNGGVFDGGNFGGMNGKGGVAQFSVTCGKGAYSSGMRAAMGGGKFLGWWTAKAGGSMQYDANGKYVGNSTCWTASGKWRHHGNALLYARWETSGEPHALKFDSNGGVFAGANFGGMSGKSGVAQISVTCGKGSNNSGMRATRSGYTFQGWWTAATGGSMQYDANGKYVGGSTCWTSDGKWQHHGNAALYARWSAAEPHGLAFDPNGGVLSGANFGAANGTSAKAQVWVTCGKGSYSVGMRATKSGATFKGWWTAPVSGGSMQYDANGKFVPNSTCWDANGRWKHHSNATLYARW